MANKKPLVTKDGVTVELPSTDKLLVSDIVGIDPTTNTDNVAQSTINANLFQYANNGKTVIANAIIAKGVSASPTDTFAVLAADIGMIPSGVQKLYAEGYLPTIVNKKTYGTATVTGLAFTPRIIIVGLKAYTNSEHTTNALYNFTCFDNSQITPNPSFFNMYIKLLVSASGEITFSTGGTRGTDVPSTTYIAPTSNGFVVQFPKSTHGYYPNNYYEVWGW